MYYNINFESLSALYLLLLIAFYYRQRIFPNERMKIFGCLMLVGLFNMLLDMLTCVSDACGMQLSLPYLNGINCIYLLLSASLPLIYYYYTHTLTDTHCPPFKKLLCSLPCAAASAMILASPWTGWIFSISRDFHRYQYGPFHSLLYLAAAIYFISATIRIIRFRQRVGKDVLYVSICFFFLMSASMLFQSLFPRYLINGTASVIGMHLFYHALQAPNDYTDVETGLRNFSAYPLILAGLYETKAPFYIIGFRMDGYQGVCSSLGLERSGKLLQQIGALLCDKLPESYILHGNDCEYLAFISEPDWKNRLLQLKESWQLKDISIQLSFSVLYMFSSDFSTAQEMTLTLRQAMDELRTMQPATVLSIDPEYIAAYRLSRKRETALERALQNDSLHLFLQPIGTPDGRICAAEALARLEDEQIGAVPSQAFIELAEKNGAIMTVGRQILIKVCRFLQSHTEAGETLHHINVNLSVVQCMQEDLSERILEILKENQIPPEYICFEITETAMASSFRTLQNTMQRLHSLGVEFALDDFGTGYANYSTLMQLPFTYVKLDKSLVWLAEKDEKQLRVLQGLVRSLKATGLSIVAEGIETAEQAKLMQEMDVDFCQGYYYARGLSETDFERFLQLTREGD